jgi:AcrR family transcriptional regulator
MERERLSAEVVVREAAELADEGGLGEVNMSALARRLGVRAASLYSHVRDQRAVVDGVHDLALDELADAVAAAIAGRAGREAVRALADATRAYAGAHPGRWAVLQQPAGEAVRTGEPARRVAELNVAVLRGYGLSRTDVVHAARILGAAVNGFLALDRAGAFDARRPAASTTWDRMLDGLDQAFAGWSA